MFSIQLKKNLSYLEKVVNIEDQSFFIFTNQNNRLCFHNFIHACLGRPSVMTKSLKKIDTEQIRNRLKEITEFFKQHLGIQHLQDYRLLNKAILKYNHLVPDHLLPVVLPLQLKELAECIPLPIIKLECKPFQAPTEKKLGVLEYFGVKSEEYLPIYKKYTSIGGEVTVLPGLKNGDRWNNPIEIISGDHFKEVCHAGLVRSQIMNLVLTLVKQVSFGTPTGMERVSPAHGVERGNDGPLNNFENDFREEFERAFGVNRESRFG